MFELVFGDDFWVSSTPLLLVGLLAALAVLAWDWRISLPAVLLVQWGVSKLAVQRSLIPDEWGSVLVWVVVTCLFILVLSILQSRKSTPMGKWGTLLFRSLLLGLAAFLLDSADTSDLLPLLDGEMTHFLLWISLCALFAIANGDGALENGLALLLWLIGIETALIAVAPAALVVVLLGTIFLLVTLACAYLLVAENTALAEAYTPITDITFPVEQPITTIPLNRQWATIRRRVADLWILAQGGNQP
jgi:hypothetical protein